jgi:hypothetical protein
MGNANNIRVAVLGTGPSGFGATIALLKSSLCPDITVFDAASGILMRHNEKKRRFEKHFTYDRNNVEFRGKFPFAPINSLGGWTKFWGATVLSRLSTNPEVNKAIFDIYENFEYLADQDSLEKYYPLGGNPNPRGSVSNQVNEILFRSLKNEDSFTGISVGKSRLAISQIGKDPSKNCILCENCLSGCSYGHILDTFDFFKKLSRTNKIQLRLNSKIDRVERDGNVLRLWARNETEQFKNMGIFDVVLVATGMGTVEILRNSVEDLKDKEFFTRETPMSIIPALVTGKFENEHQGEGSSGITFSEAFLQLSDEGREESAAQVYSVNKELRERIETHFFKIPKPVTKRMVVFMWFEADSRAFINLSNGRYVDSLYRSRENRKLHKNRFRKFRKVLKDLNIWTLPYNAFRQKAGKSYHYDGIWISSSDSPSSVSQLAKLLNDDGNLVGHGLDNCYFLGAVNQKEQNVGPTAINFMLTSYLAAKNALAKIK